MNNNTMKVAMWELRRNLTNKTFLISLIVTPVIMLVFMFLPTLVSKMVHDDPFVLYVSGTHDIVKQLEASAPEDMILKPVDVDLPTLKTMIEDNEDSGYIVLDDAALLSKELKVYTYSEGEKNLNWLTAGLDTLLKNNQLAEYGLTSDQILSLSKGVSLETISLLDQNTKEEETAKIVRVGFVLLLYINIFMASSMLFYSSMSEKKDKVVELILYSIKPSQFMQGKILGYFFLNLIQVSLWLIIGVIGATNALDMAVIPSLMTMKLIPMVLFLLGGYLLFFSLFVAIGATMEDVQSGSNFQGVIMMLPMLPILFVGPIFSSPNGNLATFLSYFPLTSPLIQPIRLALSNSVTMMQLIISFVILLVSSVLIMKMAGKIFKTAILLYDSNASIGDMIKWIKEK